MDGGGEVAESLSYDKKKRTYTMTVTTSATLVQPKLATLESYYYDDEVDRK